MIDLKDQKALEALARGLQAGETWAMHDFFETFDPVLRRLFFRKGLRHEDAEDLAAEVIEKIMLEPHKYEVRAGASFTNWVFMVARNHGISFLRRNWREEISLEVEISVTPIDQVDDRLVAELKSRIVQDALIRLSPDEREILALRNEEDADSFNEIAGKLKIKPAAARQRYRRAKEHLLRLLSSDRRAQELG